MVSLSRLIVVAALAISGSAFASTISVTTDTTMELSGTFDLVPNTPSASYLPIDFAELPDGFVELVGTRAQQPDQVTHIASFGTVGIGDPDNPFLREIFNVSFAPTIADIVGTYNNGPTGSDVSFRIFDITNQGGTNGRTFGSFEFKVAEVPLPAAAWLFLSAIAGLFGIKRLRT